MSNLNVPFLLLQKEKMDFNPDLQQSYFFSDNEISYPSSRQYQSDLQPQPIKLHLLVLADKTNGNIVLNYVEVFESERVERGQDEFSVKEGLEFSKFLIKLQPKVLCIPDILSKGNNLSLVSCLLLRSPAPHILTCSQFQLLTLHSDNVLRLWNTDDGRCVLASSSDLIQNKAIGMTALGDYPGYIAVAGDKSDIFIINVFTMEVENHLGIISNGFHSIQSEGPLLQIIDSVGTTIDLVESNHGFNQTKAVERGKWNQKEMLHFLRESGENKNLNFKFNEANQIRTQPIERSVRRLTNLQRLLSVHKSTDGSLYAFQDLIMVDYKGQKLELVEFTPQNHLVQAFFHKDLLVTIDKLNSLEIYKINLLLKQHEPTTEELEVQRVRLVEPYFKINLMNARVNDYGGLIKLQNWVEITSDFTCQEDEVRSKLKALDIQGYQFVQSMAYIYTLVNGMILTWPLKHILDSRSCNSHLSMCVTSYRLFREPSTSSLISFNSLLMNRNYKPSMFSFFYTDELITASMTFEMWYIFGTSEGRVFQVPLFQESEGKVQQVQLIAQHQHSVTLLYVANNHVLSCSQTKLVCSKIEAAKTQHQLTLVERRRVDAIVNERQTQRRRSIGFISKCDKYFQYQVKKPVFVQEVDSPSQIISVKVVGNTRPSEFFCITGDREIILVTWQMNKATRISQLTKNVKYVLHDTAFESLLLVEENNYYTTFNLRSRQHNRRTRTPQDLSQVLNLAQFIDQVIINNKHYFQNLSKSDLFYTSKENYQKNFLNTQVTKAGLHSTLDYLMMSFKMPLLYSPQKWTDQVYSVSSCKLLQQKPSIFQYKNNDLDAANRLLSTVLEIFKDEDLHAQAGPTRYKGITHQRSTILGQAQSVLILNVKDMKNTLAQQMQQQIAQEQNNSFQNQRAQPVVSEVKKFQESWPVQVISLFHPFNMSEALDEELEKYFGIHMPFLNFKMGVQGASTAMSFLISEQDLYYNRDKDSFTKTLALLRISQHEREHRHTYVLEKMLELDSNNFLNRFSNSEYWKASAYFTSIMPVIFFSALVALVAHDDSRAKLLMQDWLYQFQHIQRGVDFQKNGYSPLDSPKQVSFALLSQLVLVNDVDISYSVKDLILKPLICGTAQQVNNGYVQGYTSVYEQIYDWQILIIDTYDDMRQQQSVKIVEKTGGQIKENPLQRYSSVNTSIIIDNNALLSAQSQQQEQQLHNVLEYFGELEIAGLLTIQNFAYFTLTCKSEQVGGNKVGQQLLDRTGKLVIILVNEVSQKFASYPQYVHLATMLMWPLQYSFKLSSDIYKNSSLMEDVVKLLLVIFNFQKPQVSRDKVFKDITADNYHLMRPLNEENFLKNQASEKLLKIGALFTDQFLDIIKVHAISLTNGTDHQRNVLEILRYFIDAYGHTLTGHLIKIVQILLRCIDPNDQKLRINSHKYISVILSKMVQMFPMVSFHSATQRLAVGTVEGPIGIYDVRTSAKIEIFEGHTGSVSSLAFDQKGKWLASYCGTDLTLKLWKVGDSSFFGQLMGGNSKVANQIKLKPLALNINNNSLLQATTVNTSLSDFSRAKSIQSSGSSGSGPGSRERDTRISRCKIVFLDEDQKSVALDREDGALEVYKLVK